jgi:hypothetical protein
LVHSQAQCVGLQAEQSACDKPEPARSTKNEAPFSLVIMLDAWMVRENGPHHRIAKMPNATNGMKSNPGLFTGLIIGHR